MSFGRCCALLVGMVLIGFAGAHKVRADSIAGTGWKGKGADNNWSTANNWDSNPPTTDGSNERNLFFGQGYFNAGNNGFTTSNNNLTGWAGYRMTFEDISGQPDVSFTITGNGFTLFDFGGGFPKIENSSDVTQTISLTSGQTITLQGGGAGKAEINPVNGNLVFNSGTKVNLNSPLDIFGNNGKTLSFNDVVSGSNPITLKENSTVVLNAANTFTGNTNIQAGIVSVRNATGLGTTTSGTSVSTGAALEIQGSVAVGAEALTLNGTGVSGAGALRNISGANSWGGTVTLGSASRINSDAGSLTLTAANSITGTNQNLILGGAGDGAVNRTIITGSGTLTKDGAGTWTLSRANSYSGGTTVSGGTLVAANSSGSATGSGIVTVDSGATLVLGNGSSSAISGNITNNGTVQLNRSAGTYTGQISGTGAVTKLGTSPFTLSGANSYSGGTTVSAGTLEGDTTSLQGNITNNATLTFNQASNGTYSGNLSGTGSLNKWGAGTLTLAGTSNYSGSTSVSGGTLSIPGGGSVSTRASIINVGGAVTVGGGTGAATWTNTYAVSVGSGGTGALNITGGGSVSIGLDCYIAGGIGSNGAVTIGGGSGNSTLTNSGVVYVGDNGTGTLDITGGGSLSSGGSTIGFRSGSSSGTVTVGGGTGAATWTNSGYLTVGLGGTGTLNITGGGNVSSADGYIGDGSVSNGTVTVGSGTGSSIWTSSGTLTVGLDGTGTLNINTGGVVSTTGLAGGNGTSSVKFDGGTLRITANNTASNTINMLSGGGAVEVPNTGTTFTVTSAISGAGQLSKTGAGKLALSGANTYNGGTTISGGILQANNTTDSATGTGAVTVGNGGTLAGNGAISGAVTVNGGGTLAPGNSIESLDVGAITFSADGNGGSTFAVEMNTNAPLSMAADLLNANGGLSIVAGAILSLVDAGNTVLVPGTKLTLISYAGTWDNGIFLNHPDDSLVSVGANLFVINYDDPLAGANFGGGSYANHLTLTAVPEASAFLFGGLACLIVGLTYSARVFLRRRAVAMRT